MPRGILSLLILAGLAAHAQTLEVASVKASHSPSTESNVDSLRGRLTATNITVKELLRLAYGVREYQIGHVPGWVDNDRFDIVAKSGDNPDDLKTLVREILASRFQLATHNETKQMPVYLLVVAKDGARLTPHDDTAPRLRSGCGRLVGRRVTTDAIATMLSRQLDHEVLNRTGVSGDYDIRLEFTPDSGPCGATADAAAPSILTAVQEQLGLKLDTSKAPVPFLVIDRIEKPGEN